MLEGIASYITDMQHFDGILAPDVKVPAPARRLVEFMGKIVSAASVEKHEGAVDSAVPCRRKPGRRACSGRIQLILAGGKIVWHCPVCKDDGIISNWRGTMWDLKDGAGAVH